MSSEAVEIRGNVPPEKPADNLSTLVLDAIKNSDSITSTQKDQLLSELEPAFQRLDSYERLYEGFASDVIGRVEDTVEAIELDRMDIHERIVDESFRRVLGVRVDGLSTIDRMIVEQVLDEFDCHDVNSEIVEMVDEFQVKVEELGIR